MLPTRWTAVTTSIRLPDPLPALVIPNMTATTHVLDTPPRTATSA